MNNLKINREIKKCASCVTKPCQVGCPLNNDITSFIKKAKEKKFEEAYKIILNTSVLPSICGRICPHEKQCQGMCAKSFSYGAVQIGNIEKYIGDLAIKNNWKIDKTKKSKKNKSKIAVIGSGPSSLTCAAFLAREGYLVTIYEKHEYLGGLLYHGIPEFRLDKSLLEKSIQKILDIGIDVKKNLELGKDYTLDDLQKEYDAIFLGIGANVSRAMNIDGENLEGVYGGNELLEKNSHPNYSGKNVVVSGGGNVAMDTARKIKKLGAKSVTIVYRRAKEQMPAEKKEIKEAEEEGIKFLYKTNILRIIGKKNVQKVECIKTELVKKEDEDRLSPVNIPNSNFLLDTDYVVMAIGSKPEEKLLEKLELEKNERGYIKINENHQTSTENIFAGGDIIGNKATVAWAARSGRDSADCIINYLEKRSKI